MDCEGKAEAQYRVSDSFSGRKIFPLLEVLWVCGLDSIGEQWKSVSCECAAETMCLLC